MTDSNTNFVTFQIPTRFEANYKSHVEMRNLAFVGRSTSNNGGAIRLKSGTVVMFSCYFAENFAAGFGTRMAHKNITGDLVCFAPEYPEYVVISA